MATKTLGTTLTTSLTAILYGGNPQADIATILNGIKNDQINGFPLWPGALDSGLLSIPNRGVLKILPGDWVAIDAATGWPILVSGDAIAGGPWTHS